MTVFCWQVCFRDMAHVLEHHLEPSLNRPRSNAQLECGICICRIRSRACTAAVVDTHDQSRPVVGRSSEGRRRTKSCGPCQSKCYPSAHREHWRPPSTPDTTMSLSRRHHLWCSPKDPGLPQATAVPAALSPSRVSPLTQAEALPQRTRAPHSH